jgi:hypothetical protein
MEYLEWSQHHVRRRASIVMLLIGAVGGAVGGWFAHSALVVPAGAASGFSARHEVIAKESESSARQSLPATLTHEPAVQSPKVESRIADSARGAKILLYSAAKSAPRASTSTVAESAQPAAPSSQSPTVDDLLDAVTKSTFLILRMEVSCCRRHG